MKKKRRLVLLLFAILLLFPTRTRQQRAEWRRSVFQERRRRGAGTKGRCWRRRRQGKRGGRKQKGGGICTESGGCPSFSDADPGRNAIRRRPRIRHLFSGQCLVAPCVSLLRSPPRSAFPFPSFFLAPCPPWPLRRPSRLLPFFFNIRWKQQPAYFSSLGFFLPRQRDGGSEREINLAATREIGRDTVGCLRRFVWQEWKGARRDARGSPRSPTVPFHFKNGEFSGAGAAGRSPPPFPAPGVPPTARPSASPSVGAPFRCPVCSFCDVVVARFAPLLVPLDELGEFFRFFVLPVIRRGRERLKRTAR